MIHETSIGAARSRASRSGSALACSLVLLLTLSACGGGGGSSSPPPPPPPPATHTVGGTVTGLTGTGLVLQNNGGNNLTVNANGAFTFSTAITSGTAYAVTVLTQPSAPAQICSVTNGSGTIGANVTNVAVACVAAPTYTVGGTVTGLPVGTELVLRNNGGDDLNVGTDGAFVFGTALVTGSNYAVTVFAQPTGQTCAATNATGAVAGAAVTNIAVTCLVASTWMGIRQFGSNVNDSATVLAVDPTGGVVVGGDSGPIAGAQGAASGRYVAKYDATGSRLWLYFFPAALTALNGVGVAPDGGVYVAGTVSGTFGGHPAGDDAIVLKLRVGAAPDYIVSNQWEGQFGTAAVDIATGLAIDANGNGAVVGYSEIGTSDDGFLQRFAANVGPVGGLVAFGVGDARPRAVASDASGVFIVGDTTTSIEPGQTGTMFLRRYDATGTHVGTTQFALGVPASIAIGAGTRLHVSGTVSPTSPDPDGYLASFNRGTGAENAAALVFTSAGIDEGRGVGTAGNGDVYVTGQTQVGINGYSTGGIPNAYLVKLDPDHTIVWTQHLVASGATAATAGRAVGVLPTFGAFVAGTTSGSLPGNTTAGQTDAFIALYDAAGNLR